MVKYETSYLEALRHYLTSSFINTLDNVTNVKPIVSLRRYHHIPSNELLTPFGQHKTEPQASDSTRFDHHDYFHPFETRNTRSLETSPTDRALEPETSLTGDNHKIKYLAYCITRRKKGLIKLAVVMVQRTEGTPITKYIYTRVDTTLPIPSAKSRGLLVTNKQWISESVLGTPDEV